MCPKAGLTVNVYRLSRLKKRKISDFIFFPDNGLSGLNGLNRLNQLTYKYDLLSLR
jgi:hypothetical protein